MVVTVSGPQPDSELADRGSVPGSNSSRCPRDNRNAAQPPPCARPGAGHRDRGRCSTRRARDRGDGRCPRNRGRGAPRRPPHGKPTAASQGCRPAPSKRPVAASCAADHLRRWGCKGVVRTRRASRGVCHKPRCSRARTRGGGRQTQREACGIGGLRIRRRHTLKRGPSVSPRSVRHACTRGSTYP